MQLALELGYPRKDICYGTADITGQDYSTHYYLIYMAAWASLLYIAPNSRDYKLYRYLLRKAVDAMIAKPVNFFGNMWRVVVGTVPSGHYLTSHINSYILAWLFWSYIYGVHIRNPQSKILQRCHDERNKPYFRVNSKYFIRFVDYGDNHITAISRNIVSLVNQKGFENYLAKFGYALHDCDYDIPLISQPDTAGDLKVRGIVFLKRYFIEIDVGGNKYVVPYKRYLDGACKIVFGNSPRNNICDYIIALIGMAWDYQGTNSVVHSQLTLLYFSALKEYRANNKVPLTVYMQDAYMKTERGFANVQKLIRKSQITELDMLRFPIQSELLDRHKFIPRNHCYRRVPKTNKLNIEDECNDDVYPNRFPCN